MGEIRTQIIGFRITPTEWTKYYRQCKEEGLTLAKLAWLCFTKYADKELEAVRQEKIDQARKVIEKYEKLKAE